MVYAPPPVYSCNCACNFVNFVIIWTIWYISSCNFVNFVTIDKITGGVGSISSVNIHLNGQNWLCKLNFVNSGRSNSPKYSPPCQFCQLCQFCHRIGKIHKIDIFICSFVNFVNSGLIWLPQILPPVTVSFVSILWDLTPANTPPPDNFVKCMIIGTFDTSDRGGNFRESDPPVLTQLTQLTGGEDLRESDSPELTQLTQLTQWTGGGSIWWSEIKQNWHNWQGGGFGGVRSHRINTIDTIDRGRFGGGLGPLWYPHGTPVFKYGQ